MPYRITFWVGAPVTSPRQKVAEALTAHDCPDRAHDEAIAKRALIESALRAQLGKTFDPRCIETVLSWDNAQLEFDATDEEGKPVIGEPKPTLWQPAGKHPFATPTGDYQAILNIKVLDQLQTIGTLTFPSTTCVRAMTHALEQSREVIAELRKTPGLRKYISFKNLTIDVHRVHDTLPLDPAFTQPYNPDWSHMEYPAPRI